MKKSILIACLGLVSLGLQAQSISLAGEWNVELGRAVVLLPRVSVPRRVR